MSSFYISCGWDEAGTNPTQTQLDSAIEYLRTFPSIPRNNVLIWQPHLDGGQTFINDWWDWVYDATSCVFDYERMKLANNLVIFCLAPSPAYQEAAEANLPENVLTREHLVSLMNDPYRFGRDYPSMREWYRFSLADIHLSIHSMIDYMYRVHDMYPVMMSQINNYAKSFHHHFGHLFNNAPIYPFVMTSFHSRPKWTKHNPSDRTQLKNASGSYTFWKPYYIPSKENSVDWSDPLANGGLQMNVPWLRHWDHANRVPGDYLTELEVEANFMRGLRNGKDEVYANYNNFDITTDWAADTFGLTSPYGVEIRPDIDEWV